MPIVLTKSPHTTPLYLTTSPLPSPLRHTRTLPQPRHRIPRLHALPQRQQRTARVRPHRHHRRRRRGRLRAVREAGRAVPEEVDGREDEEYCVYFGSGWVLD